MVNAERVKIVVLMDGQSVITDLQEAVHKETGERQAWVFNYPYKVTYDSPKLEGTGISMDPDVKVYYEPWNPLTTCLLYTSPSPRDRTRSRMPSSA